MTYGGGNQDPFGGEPFAGQAPQHGFGGGTTVFPPRAPESEVNTLATLSIIFAVVFAPVGAVLGHLALSQIRQRHQRGRERAVIGVTISYIVIALSVIGLVVWVVTSNGSGSNPISPTTQSVAAPPPVTTVITPPPAQRPTINVDQLRVGDCVEVQQNKPDPNQANTDFITVFPVRCEVREGVMQVTQILSTDSCKSPSSLSNQRKTVFACIVDFKGRGAAFYPRTGR
jgi:hypothetical protein